MKEFKNIRFEMKAFNEETGEFEGMAATFRKTPDKTGDIIQPGAFTKTIKDNGGEVMLTFPPHNIMSPVGKAVMTETDSGLHVKGTILRGIQKGEEAYLLMKEKVIKTLSIGYDTIKREFKNGVRLLQEVSVGEVGLVPGTIAADDQAVILSVKTEFENRLTELEEEIKEGRVISKSNFTRIKGAITALQELLENAHLEEDEGKGLLWSKKSGESLDERTRAIYNAYDRAIKPLQPIETESGGYVREIFEDYVIVSKGTELWHIPYTEKDGEIVFNFDDATEVRIEYVPVSKTDPDIERLDRISARLGGFDEQKAMRRIDEILTKIK